MKASDIFQNEIFKVIGWSIIHSFWQFLIIFGLLKMVLLMINKNKSDLRYLVSTIFMAMTVICAIFTVRYEYMSFSLDHPVAAPAQQILPLSQHSQTVFSSGPENQIAISSLPYLNYLNNLSAFLTWGWLLGLLIFVIRIMSGGMYLNSLRKIIGESHAELQHQLLVLSTKMGIEKEIKLIITDLVNEPLTFGFLKPIILLPCSYIGQIPMQQLEMILAHELAHIKRHDYVVNLLQTSFDAIFFYNPFFRLLSEIVRNEREYCCDDRAAVVCGSHRTMAVALANIKVLTNYPMLSISAAPVESSFQQRINRLINPSIKSKLSFKVFSLTLVLIISVITLFTKCTNHSEQRVDLPRAQDTIVQLYTDNQANYKEQLFNYKLSGSNHELFLISSGSGQPVRAYVDGSLLNDTQLKQIEEVVRSNQNLTPEQYAELQKAASNAPVNPHFAIRKSTDSLKSIIQTVKSKISTQKTPDLETRLDELNALVDAQNKKEVAISMQEYRKEARDIPKEVELHNLLNKIIVSKQYTAADRNQLNALIKR